MKTITPRCPDCDGYHAILENCPAVKPDEDDRLLRWIMVAVVVFIVAVVMVSL